MKFALKHMHLKRLFKLLSKIPRKDNLLILYILAMSQGYDKEAARKRRGEKRRLKRRSAAIKQANA